MESCVYPADGILIAGVGETLGSKPDVGNHFLTDCTVECTCSTSCATVASIEPVVA